MRHGKDTRKLNRNTSHRRCLMANMVKSLILDGAMETTEAKAKELRRHADRMVTLAKANDVPARRKATAEMMVRYNELTPKQARAVKEGDLSACNGDRLVINKLFDELGPRFATRQGGYTRITRTRMRRGDAAQMVVIEYLAS